MRRMRPPESLLSNEVSVNPNPKVSLRIKGPVYDSKDKRRCRNLARTQEFPPTRLGFKGNRQPGSPSPRRRAMIVALLNQKGGVGKTTLALHVAGAWAAQGKRVVVIDADPQGSALDWSEQRAKEGLPRLFGVVRLARDTLRVEAPEIARDFNHVLIDGSSRIAALMRSAMLAADLALVPAQPSPFDGWASGEP